MTDAAEKRCGFVVGPDGSILTPSSLPVPGNIRWIAQRKAELVAAVSGGLITMQDACERYAITTEEFTDWERRYMQRGLSGLRASARSVALPTSLAHNPDLSIAHAKQCASAFGGRTL